MVTMHFHSPNEFMLGNIISHSGGGGGGGGGGRGQEQFGTNEKLSWGAK